MATTSSTTTDVQGYDINTLRNTINSVRARIAAGQPISANQIADLAWVYNTWIQHTHNYYDYYWIAYGNTSPYGTTAVWKTSGNVGVGYFSPPGAGQTVQAAHVNGLAGLVNAIRSHTHYSPDGSY
ncbi:hypothetical protein [Ralstonia phage RP31]|uniref:Uncharacterized protein n=2 Tax=Ripduovirus RP12 TaxID=2560700 RepID=A0A1L7N0Q6_9CAUD|nr:hypothetical protein FDH28_gp074 [Ralstonia phage RP12]BAW19048.1 hypothetical protein [Ralstonia phage RP12]BAW19333.1 hypothetical protein [Ralstonia phage RP31]